MKRRMTPVAFVLVVGLGSYAIFAQQQQPPDQPQQGMMGGGMGGGMMQQGGGMQGGMMGRGMMQGQGGLPCPACAAACGSMMRESVTPTSDGGVVVSVAGKLIKYDSGLKKIEEVNLDIDWTRMHQMAQQMMQNCPMMQPPTGQPMTRVRPQEQQTP